MKRQLSEYKNDKEKRTVKKENVNVKNIKETERKF